MLYNISFVLIHLQFFTITFSPSFLWRASEESFQNQSQNVGDCFRREKFTFYSFMFFFFFVGGGVG